LKRTRNPKKRSKAPETLKNLLKNKKTERQIKTTKIITPKLVVTSKKKGLKLRAII
jgi:hypothetical protein